MARVEVNYKGAEYEIFLRKLTRREKESMKRIFIGNNETPILNLGINEYETIKYSLSKAMGKVTGVDLLESLNKDEFLDALSDEDYEKVKEAVNEMNPFRYI